MPKKTGLKFERDHNGKLQLTREAKRELWLKSEKRKQLNLFENASTSKKQS